MGQYFIIVNLDKKEYINPHDLGGSLKLWELSANRMPMASLALLLRRSSQSGGGDIQRDYKTAGKWAGDKIVVIGDYDKSKLYDIAKKKYKNISTQVRRDYNSFIHEKDLKVQSFEQEMRAMRKKSLDKVV
jgi:hypothetical protein